MEARHQRSSTTIVKADVGAYASYDIIGDIAIMRIHKSILSKRKALAEEMMQTHRNVKTVLQQTSPISGDFRLRRLRWVAGEKKTETVHKEFGCALKVDLRRCYFSPPSHLNEYALHTWFNQKKLSSTCSQV